MPTTQISVSVITVCCDNPVELELTLNSVFNQTTLPNQVIVVDGSKNTTACLELLRSKKEPSLVFVAEPDEGVYDAMNKGLRLVESEWVFYLNSGDHFYDQDSLKTLVSNVDGGTDAVAGNVLVAEKNFARMIEIDPQNGYLHHQGLLYRRKIHDYEGQYFTNRGFTTADYLFFQRLIQHWRVKYVPIIVSTCEPGGLSGKPIHFYQKLAIDFLLSRISRVELVAFFVTYPIYRVVKAVVRRITRS